MPEKVSLGKGIVADSIRLHVGLKSLADYGKTFTAYNEQFHAPFTIKAGGYSTLSMPCNAQIVDPATAWVVFANTVALVTKGKYGISTAYVPDSIIAANQGVIVRAMTDQRDMLLRHTTKASTLSYEGNKMAADKATFDAHLDITPKASLDFKYVTTRYNYVRVHPFRAFFQPSQEISKNNHKMVFYYHEEGDSLSDIGPFPSDEFDCDVVIPDEQDGIIELNYRQGNGTSYDLQGRPVNGVMKKGIYIHNGKNMLKNKESMKRVNRKGYLKPDMQIVRMKQSRILAGSPATESDSRSTRSSWSEDPKE